MLNWKDVVWPEWRIRLLKWLDIVLIIFELVLSAVFILFSYLTDKLYFKGVGIGLLIAGITSIIAYVFKIKVPKNIPRSDNKQILLANYCKTKALNTS